MPIGSHHHRGPESRNSLANRYASGGDGVGYSTTNRVNAHNSGPRTSGVSADQLQRFDVLLHRAENRECFDCGAKQPRWASTNLGVFFCLRCAGVHRSMGTHISKVKSTNMDAWEEPMIRVMEHIGNARGRTLYEFNMPQHARVTSSTDTAVVERAIRGKYEKKTYYNPRFEQLYAEYMATPLDGQVEAEATAQPDAARAVNLAVPPPRRAPASQASQPQPQQPPLEELWGAPVSSPNADHAGGGGGNNATNNRHNVTSVAELFSGSHPAGSGGGPLQAAGAWGSTNNLSTRATGSASPYASPSSATNSDWFDSNFGGSTGNPRGSGAPSPATPDTPHNNKTAPTSRSNTDDLFQGSGGTPSSGRNDVPKNEILSLFASAPVAGADGQSSWGHSSPSGGHAMAWQPQTVKPYYHPA